MVWRRGWFQARGLGAGWGPPLLVRNLDGLQSSPIGNEIHEITVGKENRKVLHFHVVTGTSGVRIADKGLSKWYYPRAWERITESRLGSNTRRKVIRKKNSKRSAGRSRLRRGSEGGRVGQKLRSERELLIHKGSEVVGTHVTHSPSDVSIGPGAGLD
ncbi:unnamed protein product [Boreogadus saida]